ncbi:hypothetical protein [Bradyrhizobium sp. Tv2a-2]|uniref:hypothetical protein n=1 Tax=Bradyrhizobium sp. Tv2a-2 TaxID=113395 RepID=UPI000467BD68|nr:hypothetical protein [Bradyrhizobium sp. Tv2a-2]
MALQTRRPAGSTGIFPPRRDYASLSLKDLLDAREAYHVYLSQLDNVIATAIGRYCIRQDDWYAENPPDRPRPPSVARVKGPRTLANSVIRPWSWPAVLVFVKQWEQPEHLGANAVPSTLYLADGRVVPTCVIAAPPDEALPEQSAGPFHASHLLGGGYSCLREHQGEQALGTFACLVRKGGSYYGLTNRHVAGGDGEIVKAYIRGNYEPIGKTSNIAVDRQPMSSVFPLWGEQSTLLTLDAGLIKINDINEWTSQAFGIGEIGDVFDATEHSVTLDIIGCPVRAFGGTSGVIEGEVRALFFRYEVQGGREYATDLLIGPRRNDDHARIKHPKIEHPLTRPGDSGTLWFYDPPFKPRPNDANEDLGVGEEAAEAGVRVRRLRPIAMQWGGQRVMTQDGVRSAYALGSFLSSICRSLDVEVVRNWSLGHDEYWGKIGHFSIGWKACDRLSGDLGRLMKANQERIGFPNETIADGSGFRVGRDGFVPLADVPDYVWVHGAGRGSENIQHFADIDIEDIDGGPSMLQRCVDDPANISASKWKAYFDGFAAKDVGPEEGALPFRVWQIWDAMVAYLKKGDVLRFVAGAGVMAHYVGDASQPLHCSYMHHGIPPMKRVGGRNYPVPRDSDEFKEFKTSREAQIHGIYEETMLEVDTAGALAAIDEELKKQRDVKVDRSGHGAAKAVIALMSDAQTRLAPKTIIDADDPSLGPKARATALWNDDDIRKATIRSLADSVRVLAALWTSAWQAGGGSGVPKAKIRTYEEEELEPVYRRDQKFVPSLSLDEMAESGKFEP